MSSPLEYKIGLSLFPRVGSVNARRLVAYLGSVKAVFEASKNELKDIPGIGKGMMKNIIDNREAVLEQAEKEVKFIERYKIKSFFYLDKEYPRRLAQCDDAPVIMFMKGNIDLNFKRIISVVGTRNASENGCELTSQLIEGLSANGVEALVVSGLAYGIDITAHKAAIKHALPTVGVVAHGLDKMYPSQHAAFAKEMIVQNGALLSDFTSESKIDPGNFLRRNRIIAGLADCTIVVESAEKGGALVTADIANSYNRDVFAYPGRPSDLNSVGCNNLIKMNKAALIDNYTDLINYMGWETNSEPVQQTLLLDLSEEEFNVINVLKQNEISTSDSLSRAINLPVQKINSLLLGLEFKGVVKALPGNRFKLMVKVG